MVLYHHMPHRRGVELRTLRGCRSLAGLLPRSGQHVEHRRQRDSGGRCHDLIDGNTSAKRSRQENTRAMPYQPGNRDLNGHG